MAVASLTPRAKFSLALAAQNFRPVNLDVLTRSAALDLGSVPPDLEAALRGAVRSTTNWSRIGEQLAVLRDGLNANGKYLLDVHIGATGGALKVVTACGFGGPPPLADTQFRRSCEFSWSVMQSLEAHIQQFEIQPELLAMLDAARSKYLNVTDPVTKAAVDLAWAMVSASRASGGRRRSMQHCASVVFRPNWPGRSAITNTCSSRPGLATSLHWKGSRGTAAGLLSTRTASISESSSTLMINDSGKPWRFKDRQDMRDEYPPRRSR